MVPGRNEGIMSFIWLFALVACKSHVWATGECGPDDADSTESRMLFEGRMNLEDLQDYDDWEVVEITDAYDFERLREMVESHSSTSSETLEDVSVNFDRERVLAVSGYVSDGCVDWETLAYELVAIDGGTWIRRYGTRDSGSCNKTVCMAEGFTGAVFAVPLSTPPIEGSCSITASSCGLGQPKDPWSWWE